MQFKKISKGISILFATVLASVYAAPSMAVGPPPPGGTPDPVLTGITLSGPTLVDELTTAQYTCTGKYSDLSMVEIDAAWEVSAVDASIDGAGLMSVGNISADQNIVVSASVGGYIQTLDVVIQSVAPSLTGISIEGPSSVDEGAVAQYSCNASYSDGTVVSVVPTWTLSAESAAINAAGQLTAGNVDSDEEINVIANFNGETDSFTVSIVDVPLLEALTISGAVSLNENTSIQLSCVAEYSDGSAPLVQPEWSVSPAAYAEINANGLLTAKDVSADVGVTVSASLDGVFAASHSVLIKYVAPVLERIEISGPALVADGGTASYTCTAYYNDNTSKAVVPAWSENSLYADMDENGTLTASEVLSDQVVTLTASYGGKSDYVDVEIRFDDPVLVSLTIDGNEAVNEHASSTYTCTATYSDGSSLIVDPEWSVTDTLAEIDEAGTLSVGALSNDDWVRVWAGFGGLDVSLKIALKDAPVGEVLLESIAISGATAVEEVSAVSLTCQATYSDGSIVEVTPEWTVDSGSARIDASGLFMAGNVESDISVEVTAAFGGQTARHTISVGVISTQIIYPLTGFEGKTVFAEVMDYDTGEFMNYGPTESPDEFVLENLDTNKWYWISISESNTTDGAWDEVHAAWLRF